MITTIALDALPYGYAGLVELSREVWERAVDRGGDTAMRLDCLMKALKLRLWLWEQQGRGLGRFVMTVTFPDDEVATVLEVRILPGPVYQVTGEVSNGTAASSLSEIEKISGRVVRAFYWGVKAHLYVSCPYVLLGVWGFRPQWELVVMARDTIRLRQVPLKHLRLDESGGDFCFDCIQRYLGRVRRTKK